MRYFFYSNFFNNYEKQNNEHFCNASDRKKLSHIILELSKQLVLILFVSYNYIHTILEVQKTEICNICMTEIARQQSYLLSRYLTLKYRMTCDINENDIRDVFVAYEVKKAENTHIFRLQFFGKNCISLQRGDAKLSYISIYCR